MSITFLPYFGVVVLVGLTFSVLHTEFVSRRNFIRQKTWVPVLPALCKCSVRGL